MMDKVMTEGQTAYVFPYSGTGHEVNGKHYAFYDKLFSLLQINEYNYYGEQRCLQEVYAELPALCFYCVPGVWINGNIEPSIEFDVPFYGDDIIFPELLTPCLETSIMLPPRFRSLANSEPDTVYDYDFPCVAFNGGLSNSVHLAPYIDSMQIEHELYVKYYKMGVPVYSAVQSGDFMPLVKSKLQNGFTNICVYMDQPPRDRSLPYYSIYDNHYILFLPSNMASDEKGYIIPSIGLGEINIKHTRIVQTGESYDFR